jgi:hypothetical protein
MPAGFLGGGGGGGLRDIDAVISGVACGGGEGCVYVCCGWGEAGWIWVLKCGWTGGGDWDWKWEGGGGWGGW